jgi:hypothetical protein
MSSSAFGATGVGGTSSSCKAWKIHRATIRLGRSATATNEGVFKMTYKRQKAEPASKRIGGKRKPKEELGPSAFVLRMLTRRRILMAARRDRLNAAAKASDEADK